MPRSSNRVTWHDDTLREMARWAAKRYRLGCVRIIWRSKIEKPDSDGVCSGCTIRLDGKPPFYIELLESRTYVFLIQVLAHELTHCVAVKRYGYFKHGPTFKRVANELIAAWNVRNADRNAGARVKPCSPF